MDEYEYLDCHYRIQNGMYFSGKITKPEFRLYTSRLIDDNYWNYGCIVNYDNIGESVQLIENFLNRMDRQPCIYMINNQEIPNRVKLNYEPCFDEVWMEYFGEDLPMPTGAVLIENKSQEKDFIKIFTQAYQDGESNPWGERQEEYRICLEDSFRCPQYFNYLIYSDNQPVAVATLGMDNDCGAIYNVGTLPAFRHHGLGQKAVQACIAKFQEKNGNILFLQTDISGDLQNWYHGMGFEKIFSGTAYAKV